MKCYATVKELQLHISASVDLTDKNTGQETQVDEDDKQYKYTPTLKTFKMIWHSA